MTIFSGRCSISIEGPRNRREAYSNIGDRTDVFDGRSTMVYLPKGVKYEIAAETKNLDMGISTAPSSVDWPPVLVKPEGVIENMVGVWNWRRKVYTAIGNNVKAQRLIVGETFNPPDNWSSSPPHKHDKKTEKEATIRGGLLLQN